MSILSKFNHLLVIVIFCLLASTYLVMLDRCEHIFEAQAGVFLSNAQNANSITEVKDNFEKAMSYINSNVFPLISARISEARFPLSADVDFMAWHKNAAESIRLVNAYLDGSLHGYTNESLLYHIKHELHVYELPEKIAICNKLDVLYWPLLLWVFGILSLNSVFSFVQASKNSKKL